MKRWLARIKQFAMYTLPLALFGFAFAQPTLDDPTTWFTSPEAVVTIGGLLGTFLVNFLTSLGKNVGGTSGFQTVLLSGGISVALALLAGALGVGVFDQGILPAVGAVLVAFVGANLKYVYDKQVAESGARSAAAKAKLLR